MKEALFAHVDGLAPELCDIADKLYDDPELGMEEFHASDTICTYLENQGFSVERGVGGIPTAFRAVWKNGEGGPRVGLLCEYDALAGLGHACGHHMQGPIMLGASTAIKELLPADMPYTLVVYGTPDEEGRGPGGKIAMIENGCFRDIDCVITSHGGAETTTDLRTYARIKYRVKWSGRAAHAAAHPEKGRSAVDAMLLTMTALEYMREHTSDDTRMHYAPIHAGHVKPNIVPESAEAEIVLRCMRQSYLDDMKKRFMDILEGTALMTETTYECEVRSEYKARFPNPTMVDLFYKNAELAGCVRIEEPRKHVGSSDFGNVVQLVPGVGCRIGFAPKGTGAHSRDWLNIGKDPCAHECVRTGARTVAGIVYDIVSNPEILEKIRADYAVEKAASNAN